VLWGFRVTRLTQDEINLYTLDTIQKLQAVYEPGRDRIVTPENVFQPAVREGRDVLETFVRRLLLDGSRLEGREHLDHCLAELAAGRTVLFLSEHRGNLDAPSFNVLVREADPRYGDLLDKLVYVAGRKLNESSDFIKMFTEKYSRLVIVPKRDFPPELPDPTPEELAAREAFEADAARINRAAFRQLIRLKREGYIFVLFPLGGRWKPTAGNEPVPETVSYIQAFDTVYLVSMEGNTLPVQERMEDERPIQDTVVFRVGPALDSKTFLAQQRARYREALGGGHVTSATEQDRYIVDQIMLMLENLRTSGSYGAPAAA